MDSGNVATHTNLHRQPCMYIVYSSNTCIEDRLTLGSVMYVPGLTHMISSLLNDGGRKSSSLAFPESMCYIQKIRVHTHMHTHIMFCDLAITSDDSAVPFLNLEPSAADCFPASYVSRQTSGVQVYG